LCSPFRAAHEWRQAELAKEGRGVDGTEVLPSGSGTPAADAGRELVTADTRSS
jgi:hypothetical protein